MFRVISQGHFQARSLCEHASNWTLLLEESRNHVWSDLSRLLMLSVKMTCSLLKEFFRPEVDVDSAKLVQTLDGKRVSHFK